MNNPYNSVGKHIGPTNQKEALLMHMQSGHEVDFQEAAILGISQLTGRIAQLRKDGWHFSKREESGTNRYGNHYRKVFYSNPRRV